MELTEQGRRILEVLVEQLQVVEPSDWRTYLGYKDAHDALGLEKTAMTWGRSLQNQGLNDLADWVQHHGLPGITGVIVDKQIERPGPGYFAIYGRAEEDEEFWAEETVRCASFDWSRHVAGELIRPAVDLVEAPGRAEYTILRVIRDTKLAVKVKELNSYLCQLCNISLEMPAGKLYAEAHHLKPLGAPHNGPDVIENMVCVCPNCHAKLDYGAIRLKLTDVKTNEGHAIGQEYVEYHNTIVCGTT